MNVATATGFAMNAVCEPSMVPGTRARLGLDQAAWPARWAWPAFARLAASGGQSV